MYLENIEVKLKDKDKTLLFLNVLLNTFEHFKDTLVFEKENHYYGEGTYLNLN